ncbi:MAG TPA: 2,5-diketo-D-gluconic acid reductase [Lachnospiraceae bacterium]|nr:2,5-diketo-D-gluconic acid reductase [Lachnospiraceae bacterium]
MRFSDTVYTLNDGSVLPAIGFGTYNEEFQDNLRPIKEAIDAGYRFFDTASLYETEKYLGQAVKESGIPREDFIIETKLWIDEMGRDGVRAALDRSLKRLQTDYVDIYMIHWPRETGELSENWKERDIETYAAMEEEVRAGRVRRLGLSNFLPHHLHNILENCSIKPVVDQLELHPGYSQEAAVSYCKENDILPMAWSPLGRGRENALMGNAILKKLADKYGKSIQQVNLRFLLQKGILPIPKATSREHIIANTEVFDFELTQDELWILSTMPQNGWLGEHPDFVIPTKRSNPDNI